MFGTGSESPAAGQDLLVAALHAHSHGIAYRLFILLYFPCIAMSAAACLKSRLGWPTFMVVRPPPMVLAYLAGTAMIAVALALVFRYCRGLDKCRPG